jgi:hypothetical protein
VRLLNYTKAGRPFWNMLTVASVHDSSNTAKLLVGIQVDVTEHPTEAQAAPVGMTAAGVVGCALQRLGWEGEADPWAGFPSEVEPVKPHKAQDPAWAALQAAAQVCGEGRRGCQCRYCCAHGCCCCSCGCCSLLRVFLHKFKQTH